MITDELIAQILELESKATAGEWFVAQSRHISIVPPDARGLGLSAEDILSNHTRSADAALTVAMRNNIRELCEEVKRLRAERGEMLQELKHLHLRLSEP